MKKQTLDGEQKASVLETIGQFLATAVLGTGLGYAIYYGFLALTSLSVIVYRMNFMTEEQLAGLMPRIVTSGIVLLMLGLYFFRDKIRQPRQRWLYVRALAPLALLLPLTLLPYGFYSMLIFVLVCGWSVFRLTAVWPGFPDLPQRLSFRVNPVIVILLFAGAVVYLGWVQWKGLKVMSLTFNDWGVYYDIVLNTLKGKWFLNSDMQRSFLSEHFIPGTILLLCPFVWMTGSSIPAFFGLSAALLCCGSVFGYFWARKFKTPAGAALLLAIAILFYPSVSNMTFCIFYGFHDIYTIIPFLFLFSWLYDREKMVWAFMVFLLTLSIKETVPVFWIGMGVLIFFQGHRKWGIAIFVISLIYLLLVMKVIMPAMNQGIYSYDSRFSLLGGSMGEIALSPFTRPGVFFKLLFRPGNFYFAGMLLIPLGLLTLCRPALLLPGLVLVGATCLQDTDQLQNIALHYQTEFMTMNFVALILVYRDLQNGRDFRWHRILMWGLNWDTVRPRLNSAVLAGLLVTVGLSYYFFGLTLFGKQSCSGVLSAPDRDQEIRAISDSLPPGSKLLASERLASFFLGERNHVIGLVPGGLRPWQDYVIFDLNDGFTKRFVDPIRLRLLQDPAYNLVMNKRLDNFCKVMMFKKEPKQPVPEVLRSMSEAEWENCGMSVPSDNPAFAVRMLFSESRVLTFFVRLLRPVTSDVDISVELFDGRLMEGDLVQFGDGTSPAPLAKVGAVYSFEFKVSPEFQEFRNFRVSIRFRTPEI